MAGFEGLFADLRWIAEGDGEEESGNREGEDEDVSKAFHRVTPGGRLAEWAACRNTDSRVLESRAADGGRSVRRRRECLNCEFRFTTYERVETVPITVIKRSGNRETFSRSKLLHGLSRACEKTGLAPERLETIVDELELSLQQRNGREVSSHDIGELVLEQLRELNEVAYVRFASVYRQFSGVSDFVATLEGINASKTRLEALV